jgi:hypothetical protein
MHLDLSKCTIRFILGVFACLSSTSLLRAQEAKMNDPKQTFTGYPPAVYMKFFLACPGDKPCTRTEGFRVDPVPKGCCVLTVTSGDGRGTDEVRSYEVFLNGQRVLPTGQARNAQAAVKILQDNTLKVVLIGEPHSKVFILIAYDPRESK